MLRALHSYARHHQLDAVSPVTCDIRAPNKLASPLRRGLVQRRYHGELFESGINPKLPAVRDSEGQGWFINFAVQRAVAGLELPSDLEVINSNHDFLPGVASLFNDALFSACSPGQLGAPDYRLSIRGSEIEFHHHLVRSGLRFGTCLMTAYLHPSGSDKFAPVLSDKIRTQYLANNFKRYFTYRNRGYLMNQPDMRKLIPREFLRFGQFFLVRRHDVRGFYRWFKLLRQGCTENFERFGPRSRQFGQTLRH